VSTYGGEERRIQGLAGKPAGKGPLARPMHRWEGNIKMDLRDLGCRGTNGIHLAQ
jgi:hypothetical protein